MNELQHIKHNKIDFEKWDQTIMASQTPLAFGLSYYLNATSPGWEALIIDDYECVFPLTCKSKMGVTYLPQPPFTSQLGAFGNINAEREKIFFDFLFKKYKLIEIELNWMNKIKSKFLKEKKTYIINYVKGYKFNQNTKRNITNAVSNKLTVEKVNDSEVSALAKLHLNPFLKETIKLPEEHINLMAGLLSNALEAKQLFTFKVVNPLNEIKAIAFFICNSKHALYLKGTVTEKAENSGCMHLLMSYAIGFFSDKSVFFDFGGGSNSEGLANFYKGFGGEACSYGFLKVNQLPKLLKLLKAMKYNKKSA